ncbi:MAG: DUF86 domain-containing protein [Chloroflexota bacterium]|nr:DUF86 domain-containing protein [Chloroflexota bacterium]
MSDRRDRDYIGDIRDAIERIQRYTNGMSREQFEEDEKTQDAVIRNLEVIGEAAKGVSTSARRENLSIPWKDLAGVRDKLIHHYFGVNLAIVWKIIHDDLATLQSQLEEILNNLVE